MLAGRGRCAGQLATVSACEPLRPPIASTTTGACTRTSAPVASFTITAPDKAPAVRSNWVTRWRLSTCKRPPGSAPFMAAIRQRVSSREVPHTTW